MSALVVVLGLWALGLVALAWVVVLSRMLTARRESTDRVLLDWRWLRLLQQSRAEDTGWMVREWGDTAPMPDRWVTEPGWTRVRVQP